MSADRHFGLLELTGGGLRVEHNANRVLAILPGATVTRTEHVVQLELPGARGLVALVTAETLELRLPTVEWTQGVYDPVPASRLFRRVKVAGLTDERLSALIDEAVATRRAEFKKCRFCGDEVPREHRHGNACHGCAEKHLGICH